MLSRNPSAPSAPPPSAMFRKQCCSECGTVTDSGEITIVRGDLVMDRALRRATWKGHDVRLSAQQFAILEMLVRREGRVIQFWAFYANALNDDTDGNVLQVQLCRMRKTFRAVDPEFDQIESVRGQGLMWRHSRAEESINS